MRGSRWILAGATVALAAVAGCSGRAADVVLYCAVDQSHSEPLVRAFERETGLRVEAYYDVEATKSVGLRRRLEEEAAAARPVCDVFWNNEVVQTVVLARQGLLESYVSPEAAGIPEGFRDPGGLWTGFAARGRVLIVNTERLPDPARRPSRTADFLEPAHADRCGMARPLTGTTAAHAAAWLSREGEAPVFDRLRSMLENRVRFGPGNAQVMRLVRDGQLDFGFTDTDDCLQALREHFPVAQVVPDQADGEMGLIVVPNTVALVRDAPHPDAARRLIDWLLRPATEAALAAGPSGQIPLRDGVPRPEQVLDLSRLRLARVDWQAAGTAWVANAEALETLFTQ